ncbi:MAG: fluoride efflux transporter CrcB [Methylococcales bacterium]|nr:fluoride efflux transporter CrcB [Methylococcales bacterium]MDD5754721.1 fluoride efflux transporter CrcB [Methylococcales bacterium]
MNQLIVIAIGGSFGAVMRFLVSTGLYQWLGRGFPYGTLLVNIVGSFLIGLLSETLILQRITVALDYRAAILVGFIGAFTTFSTFSLETFYLLEQGQIGKAGLNVAISVSSCLAAVWIGLLCGRGLFWYSSGVLHLPSGVMPYGMMVINAIGALLIGIVAALLLQKIALPIEQRATLLVLIIGVYLTLSGLYLILFLIEHGFTFDTQTNFMLGLFVANSVFCSSTIGLGLLLGKQI